MDSLIPNKVTFSKNYLKNSQNTINMFMITAMKQLCRSYLPPNVTKFNAHYIHGKTWGEMEPKPEDTVYESLYPQVRIGLTCFFLVSWFCTTL